MKQLEMKSAIYLVVGVLVGIVVYAGYQRVFLPSHNPEQVQGTPILNNLPVNNTPANTPSPSGVSLPGTAQGAPTTSTITLPVQKMEMLYGADCAHSKISATQQFDGIPANFADNVDAYGFSTCGASLYVLGPKDWVGSGQARPDEGFGDSVNVSLNRQAGLGDSRDHMNIKCSGGCSVAVHEDAPFHGSKDKIVKIQNLLSTAPKTIVQLTPNLIVYSLPNTSDGREVNGVAYYSGEVQINPHVSTIETTLLPSEHDLAIAILNSYIQKQGLNK